MSPYFRYFDCFMKVKGTDPVQRCERQIPVNFQDASSDRCQMYDNFIDCIHDSVYAECGSDGWEILFQFMSLHVRQYVPQCRVRRIFRVVKLTQV